MNKYSFINFHLIPLYILLLFPLYSKSSYDSYYKGWSEKNNLDTAIIIVAYNRPTYFKQCIKSIEQNPESQYLPFIFALDGGPGATQQENINIINSSKIKNKIFLKRTYNYGCPKNHIDSKRFAFEWCKFKKIIVLEDDITITPNYFKFIDNLYNWSRSKYSNIGAVQGWSYCWLSQEEKRKNIDIIKENSLYWSWVSYCMDLSTWNKIKPILYTFEAFIDKIPPTPEYSKLRSKPYLPEIRQWVNTLAKSKTLNFTGKPRNLLSLYTKEFKKKFSEASFLPAQDVIMGFSFFMNDLVKIHPLVNRVIHIGIEGITSNEDRYYAKNLHKIHLNSFKIDKFLKRFKLVFTK